jgi:class 3 adenylate cyclase
LSVARRDLRSEASEVRYARSGDVDVAYRVISGDTRGAHEFVVVMGGTMPMDALFDDRVSRRFIDAVAELGRLVLFDRSGIGMSDAPPEDEPRLGRWRDDIDAVVGAAGIERPILITGGLGAAATILYSATHADAVTSVVMVEPSIRLRMASELVGQQIRGEVDSASYFVPSRAEEPGFREWWTRAGQQGAGPRRAARAYDVSDDDIRVMEAEAARIRAPVLVLRRPAHSFSPPPDDDPMMKFLPNAVRVDLPGEDLWILGNDIDEMLAEITRFVTGEHRAPTPERVLAAILYSDLVASTDRATELGDARWKHVLDRHDEIARSCVARRGGVVVKHMGDGVLATLPSASSAIHAARELRAALRAEGLVLRVGIHAGDVDRRDDDLSGLNVVVAARICDLAAAGEIVVSITACTAATGESVQFAARGDHELKGVPGTWPLFTVVDA